MYVYKIYEMCDKNISFLKEIMMLFLSATYIDKNNICEDKFKIKKMCSNKQW